MRLFVSLSLLVVTVAAACLLAVSSHHTASASRIEGSIVLTNPTSNPVPDTVETGSGGGAGDGSSSSSSSSYVNTERLVQQSARQIEEAIEQSAVERRPSLVKPQTLLSAPAADRHTEVPTTAPVRHESTGASPTLGSATTTTLTAPPTSTVNPGIIRVSTTTEAAKPVRDNTSSYARKKKPATTLVDKKVLFAKKPIDKRNKAANTVTDGATEVARDTLAGRPQIAISALLPTVTSVTPNSNYSDSSIATTTASIRTSAATTTTTTVTTSTITATGKSTATPGTAPSIASASPVLYTESGSAVTVEDDAEVGPECTSKIRLPSGFKLWRSKDKNKLNLTLATDNLSCSISSGLSVSSNTTSHLVLDAQVGDQIRLFVDELDERAVVTLHRSQEEALTECVEPPHGSVVWNATTAENFVIQADLLAQSGLQFFAVAVQSSSLLRVWHIRISVYDSECDSRRGSTADLCSERGVCALAPGESTFSCHCCVGVKGRTCDELDACAPSPCRNNGFCVDISEGLHGSLYQCLCPHAFRGANCEENADFCEMHHPCKNNATCLSSNSANTLTGSPEYICQCQKGFEGPNCEVNIDECESKPCVHGMCEDGVGEFKCYCLPGYGGELCEFEYDECDSSPCVNNGACEDLIAGYKCHCGPGYTGRRCEIKVDLCKPNPCVAPATCIDRGNNYTCVCRGSGCASRDELDPCYPNPCQHGGSCWPSMDTFYCSCPPGFAGDNCEEIAYPQAIAERHVYNPDESRRPSSERLHTIYMACATLAGACALIAIAVTVCQCRLGRPASPDHLAADCERLRDDTPSARGVGGVGGRHLADEDPLFPETSSAFRGSASRLHLSASDLTSSRRLQHQQHSLAAQQQQRTKCSNSLPFDSMRTPLLFPESPDHGHY